MKNTRLSKYNKGDLVSFTIEGITRTGNIIIIDYWPECIEYDIFVENENCLYKHIPERLVFKSI